MIEINAESGQSVTFQVMTEQGSGPITWELFGAPSYVTISASGLITANVPATESGTFEFTVNASNCDGASVSQMPANLVVTNDPTPTEDVIILNGTNYYDIEPEQTEWNIERARLIYEQSFFPNRAQRIENNPAEPTNADIDFAVDTVLSHPANEPVHTDIEIWWNAPFVQIDEPGAYYNSLLSGPNAANYHPDGEGMRNNLRRHIQTLTKVRSQLPDRKITMYSLPAITDYYGYTDGHPNVGVVAAGNELFDDQYTVQDYDGSIVSRSLLDVIDMMCPSLYVRVLNRTAPDWYADQREVIRRIIVKTVQIRDQYETISGRRLPIVPYVWPQHGPQVDAGSTPVPDRRAYKYIAGPDWRRILEATMDAGADGFTLWGGAMNEDGVVAAQPWDPNADWWLATEQFLTDRGYR